MDSHTHTLKFGSRSLLQGISVFSLMAKLILPPTFKKDHVKKSEASKATNLTYLRVAVCHCALRKEVPCLTYLLLLQAAKLEKNINNILYDVR